MLQNPKHRYSRLPASGANRRLTAEDLAKGVLCNVLVIRGDTQ